MSAVPRELHHFLLLSREEQADAIRRLATSGMSEQCIAAATRLSIEMVRRVLAGHDSRDAQNGRRGAPENESH